ncbi:unnamed protein product [Didymodactylos carnosus]|uniref:Gustatory receptor n=1 Tax=Didymodactylos carnosus TaxID=1234261 RepID=A0A814ZY31_9BILA|nr:unnamed protein product [Didymodactylos carnosus]CAF1527563.1 unnamed protein product [Didymodactylos carnosus]CAF4017462.1 unnamed protein product [Didymodactylos carnosus]CAF4314247.1 unnamed protein product [Didymodactylos carnosus]
MQHICESKDVDLTIGFLLKPLLTMMKLTGLYHEYLPKADKQKQNRLHFVYCLFICFLLWFNTFKFIFVFVLTNLSYKYAHLPRLVMEIVCQLWLLLCSSTQTAFVISSYQRNKFYTIMFDYNFAKGIKCQPSISKRLKFVIYSATTFALITIICNTLALFLAYFGSSEYIKVFQMLLAPFHQNSTIARNIPYKLFICLLQFYDSAAWILPPTLFAILCLIAYNEFNKFNEYIKEEVQQSNAQQRVEYWRQSHNKVVKLVYTLDSTFQIYSSLALSINIVMALLMWYIIAIMWTYRPDGGTLMIVMVLFWAFNSMVYIFVIAITAGLLNSAVSNHFILL